MSDRGYYTPRNNKTPQFKTPLPYTPKQPVFDKPDKQSSDSEESTCSSAGTQGSSENGELTIVAEYDDLMRGVRKRRRSKIEDAYLEFADQVKEICTQWHLAVQECQRLQALLDRKTQECHDVEVKLVQARKLLDRQTHLRKKTEQDKECLVCVDTLFKRY